MFYVKNPLETLLFRMIWSAYESDPTHENPAMAFNFFCRRRGRLGRARGLHVGGVERRAAGPAVGVPRAGAWSDFLLSDKY